MGVRYEAGRAFCSRASDPGTISPLAEAESRSSVVSWLLAAACHTVACSLPPPAPSDQPQNPQSEIRSRGCSTEEEIHSIER